MKKIVFFFFTFVMAMYVSPVIAQEITVEQADGSVSFYHDLNEAIPAAKDGATILLPAGGFSLDSSVKINKRISLIGVGYRPDKEGGLTHLNGTIQLDSNASGSVIMGVSVNEIQVGLSEATNNVLIQYCRISGRINVNGNSIGVNIKQNIIEGGIYGGTLVVKNNIVKCIYYVNGGEITNNVIYWFDSNYPGIYAVGMGSCGNVWVKNNIIFHTAMNCQLQLFQNNLGYKENAGISIDLGGKGIKDIFVKINEERTFDFQNDYHLKDDAVGKGAGSDGTDVGIYGGNGFNEMGTPPYPYVIFKKVPNETDAQGNLKIKVKVMTL